MKSNPNTLKSQAEVGVEPVQALRLQLHAHGYEPTPALGKRAIATGWASGEMTEDRVRQERADYSNATNTGLRTGQLVGVDVDLTDAGEVAAAVRLIQERLGPSDARRRGSKGLMLCYQNAEPIRKITVASSDGAKVEILGSGQQFIAYGVHPETGKPYEWAEARAEPARCPLDFLPSVTPDQLRAVAQQLRELLARTHPNVKVTGDLGEERAKPDASASAGIPIPPGEMRARFAYLDPSCGRDEWIRIAGAANAMPCTDPDAPRMLFVEWSRGGDNYTDDDACEQAFDTMSPKDGGVGAGSFIRMTDAAGYVGPTAGKNDTPAAEVFADYLATLAPSGAVEAPADAWAARVAKFRGTTPADDVGLPPPQYWDDYKTLPKAPGGHVGLVVAGPGSHKTGIISAILMEIIEAKPDARVAFMAGEGAYGYRAQRLPAYMAAAGFDDPSDLDARWRTVPNVINLPERGRDGDTEAFIEAQREFRPNLVVVDTLATALGGEDENSSSTASLLTANGPAGRIASAFDATVIFVHHTGKDAGRGARGSSAFTGNTDFVWIITFDAAANTAKLHVKKMRDGPSDFSVYFRIRKGLGGVPLALRISEDEWKSAQPARPLGEELSVVNAIRHLRGNGPVPHEMLARELIGSQPKEMSDQEYAGKLKAKREWLASRTRKDKTTGQLGPLAQYILRDDEGEPLKKPMLWDLPKGGGEDDGVDE